MDEFIESNYKLIIYFLLGVILIGLGAFFYKTGGFIKSSKIEVLNPTTTTQETGLESGGQIVAEISGAVEKPGVYTFQNGSRIDDLLITSGGLSANADRVWVDKNVNKAAKLSDGQKIYIYQLGEATAKTDEGIKLDQGVLGAESTTLVNINNASLTTLDNLPGIGPVYGQNIIEQRPYSNTSELLSKGILKESVYEKIKNMITVN